MLIICHFHWQSPLCHMLNFYTCTDCAISSFKLFYIFSVVLVLIFRKQASCNQDCHYLQFIYYI